jgi:hypothetical protein
MHIRFQQEAIGFRRSETLKRAGMSERDVVLFLEESNAAAQIALFLAGRVPGAVQGFQCGSETPLLDLQSRLAQECIPVTRLFLQQACDQRIGLSVTMMREEGISTLERAHWFGALAGGRARRTDQTGGDQQPRAFPD